MGGNLDITAAGITHTGALEVTGTSSFEANANGITLTNSANDFNGAVTLSGNTVAVVDRNSIDLATSTVTGDLTVDASGDITQTVTGTLDIGGTSGFQANGNDITLTNPDNDFGGAVSLFGDDVSVVDSNSVEIDPSTVIGDLTVTTNNIDGDIQVNGAVSAGGGLTFDAVGDVIIGDSTGVFDVLAGSDIDIQAGDVTLGSVGDVIIDANVETTSGNIVILAYDLDIDVDNTIRIETANPDGTVTIADQAGGISLGTDASLVTVTGFGISDTELARITSEEVILQSGSVTLTSPLDTSASSTTTVTGRLKIDAGTFVIQDFTPSQLALTGGNMLHLGGDLDLANTDVSYQGFEDLLIKTEGSFLMGPGSSITTTSQRPIEITADGAAILGLLNAGRTDFSTVTVTASDILNGFGPVSNLKLSETNIIAGSRVNLFATDRIGESSTDAITIDADKDGSINLRFGAQFAYINTLNFPEINCLNCVAGRRVIVGLVFSNQVFGIGHNVGLDAAETLNPLNQVTYDDILADETVISILGADFQVFFDEDEEDDIVSSIIPSVPIMIKTLEGWDFVAPTRRQRIDRMRDRQKKGESFIDWL